MNGTLMYGLGKIPRMRDSVIIVVSGDSFPSGVWYGYISDIERGEKKEVTPCVAKIHGEFYNHSGIFEWADKEPRGKYSVYPHSVGMDALVNQINIQKAEVKALKKQLAEKEQKARDVLKGLLDLAGTQPYGVCGLGELYKVK